MPEQERLFYELMWRIHGRGRRMPLPWWVQQYFRAWSDDYDGGLFESREAAFCSNAHYRYWNMVGVKEHSQECLVGQAGEVEPVYDRYALSCFLFDPATRELWFPQYAGRELRQSWQNGYLPVLRTEWGAPSGHRLEQRMLATTVGVDQKALGLLRLSLTRRDPSARPVWLCVSVSPAGPTGFERHDRARAQPHERWLTYLRYHSGERRLTVNQSLGPLFDTPPRKFGMYGNGTSPDADFYLAVNPYEELRARGALNGWEVATICSVVIARACSRGKPTPTSSGLTSGCRSTTSVARAISRSCGAAGG